MTISISNAPRRRRHVQCLVFGTVHENDISHRLVRVGVSLAIAAIKFSEFLNACRPRTHICECRLRCIQLYSILNYGLASVNDELPQNSSIVTGKLPLFRPIWSRLCTLQLGSGHTSAQACISPTVFTLRYAADTYDRMLSKLNSNNHLPSSMTVGVLGSCRLVVFLLARTFAHMPLQNYTDLSA